MAAVISEMKCLLDSSKKKMFVGEQAEDACLF
jgi:hypothetical protein